VGVAVLIHNWRLRYPLPVFSLAERSRLSLDEPGHSGSHVDFSSSLAAYVMKMMAHRQQPRTSLGVALERRARSRRRRTSEDEAQVHSVKKAPPRLGAMSASAPLSAAQHLPRSFPRIARR